MEHDDDYDGCRLCGAPRTKHGLCDKHFAECKLRVDRGERTWDGYIENGTVKPDIRDRAFNSDGYYNCFGCKKKHAGRSGLCTSCLDKARKDVKTGKTSWDRLEANGDIRYRERVFSDTCVRRDAFVVHVPSSKS